MFIRHPGRFGCMLDKFLYGLLSSREFAELVSVSTKAVMAWRDRRKSPQQNLIPRIGYEVHRFIEQQIIPQPRCITKLNQIMNRSPKNRKP